VAVSRNAGGNRSTTYQDGTVSRQRGFTRDGKLEVEAAGFGRRPVSMVFQAVARELRALVTGDDDGTVLRGT
jgi:hypothetical protein